MYLCDDSAARLIISIDSDDWVAHFECPGIHDLFDSCRKDDSFYIGLRLKSCPQVVLSCIAVSAAS